MLDGFLGKLLLYKSYMYPGLYIKNPFQLSSIKIIYQKFYYPTIVIFNSAIKFF